SPYSYCAGNPIRYVDPDGRRIKPIGSQAQNIILSTLSEYERPYVSVNEDGYIDSELLLSCNSHSNNFTCLKDLVMSPYNIEVSTNEIMNYIGGTEEFKEIEYVKGTDIFGNSFEDVNFNDVSGNVDGATGRLGVTYMPVGENETGKAPLDNSSIQININPHLGNSRTAAETFAHEGYGHAIMYVRTGDRSKAVHNPDKKKNKDVELNIELKNAIILGRKEAVDNFNSY
ncbi:MAG: hypothetical protein Q4A15_10835, partial [Prevotellaceae bacterium]|nr:hypothetical protein [Prevotellaceae bacterium]